jgi:hypothetical protein
LDALRRRYRLKHPPRTPRGWSIGPPDFVGVGAEKAGTTWWYELIEDHPRVVVRRMKELNYFAANPTSGSHDENRNYHRYFARPPDSIVGEWTPGYLSTKSVPPLLREVAPEAKILVIIRDPVDRYVSAVTYFRKYFPDQSWIVSKARAWGFYAADLEHLYQHFDRDRVLVLQYEKCKLDTSTELRRTYEFLGLDDGFMPRRLHRKVNVTPGPRYEPSPDERAELVKAYTDDVKKLMGWGAIDVSLWPNFAHLAPAPPKRERPTNPRLSPPGG